MAGEHDVPGADDVSGATDAAEDAPAGGLAALDRLPAPALIGVGVVLGVLVLFTVAWASILLGRLDTPPQPLLDGLDRAQLVLGVGAPLLWGVAGLILLPGRHWPWKALWGVAGLVLLAPWPWILTLIIAAGAGR
jgi:hypothetical protein